MSPLGSHSGERTDRQFSEPLFANVFQRGIPGHLAKGALLKRIDAIVMPSMAQRTCHVARPYTWILSWIA